MLILEPRPNDNAHAVILEKQIDAGLAPVGLPGSLAPIRGAHAISLDSGGLSGAADLRQEAETAAAAEEEEGRGRERRGGRGGSEGLRE